jgi:hypothetical protein
VSQNFVQGVARLEVSHQGIAFSDAAESSRVERLQPLGVY